MSQANIIQISDTELGGVPYDDILDNYEAGDVDAIVFAGDGSKKFMGQEEVPNDMYFEQLVETYDDLDRLGEELDVEVYTIPGNHEPIEGAHHYHPREEEKVSEIEQMLEDEYEDFVDYEGNAYQFMVDSHDNLVDLEFGSADIGDYTIVGGTHHLEDEKLLEEPERGMFDYDYEEIAAELEDRHTPDYGLLGSIPILGSVVKAVGSFIGYGQLDLDPEELGLEDIPEDMMSEAHKEYLEERELLQEEFNEKKDKLGQLIEDAENDVVLFNHGMPNFEGTDVEVDYKGPEGNKAHQGSSVFTELLEEHSDKIVGMGAGHFHSPGEYEMHDVDIINSAEGYTDMYIEDGSIDSFDYTPAWEEGQGSERQRELTSMLQEKKQAQQERMEALAAQAREDPEGFRQRLVESGVSEEEADRFINRATQSEVPEGSPA